VILVCRELWVPTVTIIGRRKEVDGQSNGQYIISQVDVKHQQENNDKQTQISHALYRICLLLFMCRIYLLISLCRIYLYCSQV